MNTEFLSRQYLKHNAFLIIKLLSSRPQCSSAHIMNLNVQNDKVTKVDLKGLGHLSLLCLYLATGLWQSHLSSLVLGSSFVEYV